MIEIKNLNKSFNKEKVFEDFNIIFNKGKIYYIMGPSGFGKTTLFNILLDLEDYKGNIKGLDGKISVLFQENRLFEERDIFTNINFVQERDLNRDYLKAELKKIGLEINLETKINKLSGGMKRRISLMRALLVNADIYILDEPFKELDENSKNLVLEYILNIKRDKTFLISGHDIKDGEKLKAEIIKLHKK